MCVATGLCSRVFPSRVPWLCQPSDLTGAGAALLATKGGIFSPPHSWVQAGAMQGCVLLPQVPEKGLAHGRNLCGQGLLKIAIFQSSWPFSRRYMQTKICNPKFGCFPLRRAAGQC